MLASASHDGTVRLWVTPEPRPVLEYGTKYDPESEFTSHDPRRQGTMETEGTAAHSSSGGCTPVPFAEEPQTMETDISPHDDVDAPLSAQLRRVDSPLPVDFDASQLQYKQA